VVTAALEIQRQDKVIGASLEAAPVVHVADPEVLKALKSVDFADICITSGLVLTGDPPAGGVPPSGSRGRGRGLREAEGEKCQRCWKILPDVGTHRHPGVCGRCDAALG
jgi:isoleucyl-tRNA synthetase